MKTIYAIMALAAFVLGSNPASAAECTASSEKDLQALFAHFANPNDTACKIGAIQRHVVIDGGENGTNSIILTKFLVVPDNVKISSPSRFSFLSNLPNAEGCLITLGVNSTLDNVIVLNNSEKKANAAVCANSSNSIVKDVKIIGGYGTIGVIFNGTDNVMSHTRIKIDNGIGVILGGNYNSVLGNKVDTKNTGIIVAGQEPVITGNEIYGTNSFNFQSNPALKLSDAANILQANPSLYFDATGELDEEVYAKDNFAAVYAKDEFTGDLTYCPPPNGDPYYKPGLASLICNPAPVSEKTELKCPAPAPVECPLSGKLENGVCIVEKVVEKIVEKLIEKPADISKDGTTPKPGPMIPTVAQPSSGGGGCSLIRSTL